MCNLDIIHSGVLFGASLHIQTDHVCREMHLKMPSGKWQPFCLGLNVLSRQIPVPNMWDELAAIIANIILQSKRIAGTFYIILYSGLYTLSTPCVFCMTAFKNIYSIYVLKIWCCLKCNLDQLVQVRFIEPLGHASDTVTARIDQRANTP